MNSSTSAIAMVLYVMVMAYPAPAESQQPDPAGTVQTERPDSGRFSGKMTFHQKDGGLTYQPSIRCGRVVGGSQHFGDTSKPVAEIVGGWYDQQRGTLVLLIQGSDALDEKWRAQAQHFRIDTGKKEVVLEHVLYGYGITEEAEPVFRDHVLDELAQEQCDKAK